MAAASWQVCPITANKEVLEMCVIPAKDLIGVVEYSWKVAPT